MGAAGIWPAGCVWPSSWSARPTWQKRPGSACSAGSRPSVTRSRCRAPTRPAAHGGSTGCSPSSPAGPLDAA